MPNPKVSLLCACAAAALALPAAASAQVEPGVHIDPGVNYDPNSPAGKEYSIPLVEGRSEGAGTTNQQKGANVPFGLGIKPPGGGDGNGKRGGRDGHAGGTGSTGGRAEGPQGARPGESAGDFAARIASAEQPGGTAASSLLLALAVLGPAGLLALLLWQRRHVSRTGRTA
jgi:hypothetical protein